MSAPGREPVSAPARATPLLRRLGVLVPVRDEERLLDGALRSLGRSADLLGRVRPDVRVDVVVVLDGCTDRSAQVAQRVTWPRGLPRPRLLRTGPAGVGAARAAGADLLLAGSGPSPADPDPGAGGGGGAGARRSWLERTWVAGTDADTIVPATWLLAQVEAAEQGWDAWVGTVVLSARDELAARWTARQQHVEGHPHVHGANLGVRASAYRDVGGYRSVLTGEDVLLVEALAAAGSALLRTARHPVTTSARRRGRAPEGVAVDLAELERERALPAPARGGRRGARRGRSPCGDPWAGAGVATSPRPDDLGCGG